MSATAIEVEGLAKRYALGRTEERGYRTLRDALAGFVRPRSGRPTPAENEVWALRDVSFAVAEGEALGVIGHNGAGKSTLLKIFSRVTEPSAGRARLRGRVASLLEVGTGFHPELTGRENVFLNGSILGMTRAEIRASFDAIVAFAEIERFLDTPVKRYSSGMYVRLAFAVAAHLTPEILIVDEVLAVGDHEFQRRCLGRMSAVAHGGRTVLFVSHNLRAVEDLCPRTLLLRGGRIERLGPTREVVAHYLARRAGEGQTQAPGIIDVGFVTDREGTGRARLTRLELMDAEGTCRLERATFGQSFRIRWHYTAEEPVPGAALGFSILSENNVRLFTTSTDDHGLEVFSPGHQGHVDCLVRAPNLLPGSYRFDAWITDPVERLYADHVPFFGALEIARGGAAGSAAHWDRQDRGILHLDCAWLIEGTRG